MQPTDHQLDRVFHALSDTTRRHILERIRSQDETVNNLAMNFEISLPAVSKHLKVLEKAGLISRRRDGQKRFCHVEPAMMESALQWLEYYQSFWNSRLENLKTLLEQDGLSKPRSTEQQ